MTCGFIKCRICSICQWCNNQGGNQNGSGIFRILYVYHIFHLISPKLRPFHGRERRNVKHCSYLPCLHNHWFQTNKFVHISKLHIYFLKMREKTQKKTFPTCSVSDWFINSHSLEINVATYSLRRIK